MGKILKVTLEFEDETKTLEGEDAEKWLSEADRCAVMEHIHGRPFPEFKWKITPKRD